MSEENKLKGIHRKGNKVIARLGFNRKEYEKEFTRKADAVKWRVDLHRDLSRCPGGISFHARNGWTARVATEDGEVAKTFPDLNSAINWQEKTNHQVLMGTYLPEGLVDLTLSAYSSEWMQLRVSVKKVSLMRDEVLLKNHILPSLGHLPLVAISSSVVENWVAEMSNAGKSPQTIDKAFGLLNQMLRASIKRGVLVKNAAFGISTPKVQAKPQKSFSEDEILAISRECGHYGYIVTFLARTGLRPAEFAALKVGDFDTKANELVISNNFTLDEDYSRILDSTKTNQVRRIPISGSLLSALKPFIDGRLKNDWLFQGKRGGPMDPNYFRKSYFMPAIKKLGLSDVTLYTLRHTFGSILLGNGVDVVTVSKLMGHATVQQTLNTYAHVLNGNQFGAMQKMNDIFDRVSGEGRGELENQGEVAVQRTNHRPGMPSKSRHVSGRPRRIRTDDPRIKSPLL
jgi:integrase